MLLDLQPALEGSHERNTVTTQAPFQVHILVHLGWRKAAAAAAAALGVKLANPNNPQCHAR
jgi:hypothetical protein